MLDNILYRASWLGGALHFFIFKSPWGSELSPCSPCVPNARDIHPRDKILPVAEAVLSEYSCGYTTPQDWVNKETE